jgi:hypothetical protein
MFDQQAKNEFDADFIRLGNFHEGLARVKFNNGRFGYINTQGKKAFDTDFHRVDNFHEGLAQVILNNRRFGYIKESRELEVTVLAQTVGLSPEQLSHCQVSVAKASSLAIPPIVAGRLV